MSGPRIDPFDAAVVGPDHHGPIDPFDAAVVPSRLPTMAPVDNAQQRSQRAPLKTGVGNRLINAVGQAANSPFSTAVGIATAPVQAGVTGASLIAQRAAEAGLPDDTKTAYLRTHDPERVSDAEGALAALQLATIGVGKFVPALARGVASTKTLAPVAAPLWAKMIAQGTYGGAAGAAFMPDDPVVGALLGTGLGAGHAAVSPMIQARIEAQNGPKPIPNTGGTRVPASEVEALRTQRAATSAMAGLTGIPTSGDTPLNVPFPPTDRAYPMGATMGKDAAGRAYRAPLQAAPLPTPFAEGGTSRLGDRVPSPVDLTAEGIPLSSVTTEATERARLLGERIRGAADKGRDMAGDVSETAFPEGYSSTSAETSRRLVGAPTRVWTPNAIDAPITTQAGRIAEADIARIGRGIDRAAPDAASAGVPIADEQFPEGYSEGSTKRRVAGAPPESPVRPPAGVVDPFDAAVVPPETPSDAPNVSRETVAAPVVAGPDGTVSAGADINAPSRVPKGVAQPNRAVGDDPLTHVVEADGAVSVGDKGLPEVAPDAVEGTGRFQTPKERPGVFTPSEAHTVRDEFGNARTNLDRVPNTDIEAEIRALSEKNAQEEGAKAAREDDPRWLSVSELPATEQGGKLGRRAQKAGKESLPDGDGMYDPDELAKLRADDREYRANTLQRTARTKLAERLQGELDRRTKYGYSVEAPIDPGEGPLEGAGDGSGMSEREHPTGEPVGAAEGGTLINRDKVHDPMGLTADDERQLREDGFGKERISWKEQGDAARPGLEQQLKYLLADGYDAKKAKNMTVEQIGAVYDALSDNIAQRESAMHELASDTIDSATEARLHTLLDGLNGQAETLTKTISTGSSQKGRDFNYMKQMSARTLDPAVWLVQAQRAIGDAVMTDELRGDVLRMVNDARKACGL
jgi:hypothetical protein